MMLLLVCTLTLPLVHAADDCPASSTVASFLEQARLGELAFAEMDTLGLAQAREQALARIPCLSEPITPRVAAAFHRMMAMSAFASGDEDAVLAEFHAARRLEPGYAIPLDVAPAGHPLVVLYERAVTADEGGLDATIPPLGGYVTVDGVLGAPRPTGISSLVQSFQPGDVLERTLFLAPGESTPTFGPMPLDELRRVRRRWALGGSSAAAFVAGGVLYGLAWRQHANFWDEDDPLPDENLAGARTRSNTLFLSAVGAGTVGLGFGVATAIAW